MKSLSTLVVKYPNGCTQVVKPNPAYFSGDWQKLAEGIARPHLQDHEKVKYELK